MYSKSSEFILHFFILHNNSLTRDANLSLLSFFIEQKLSLNVFLYISLFLNKIPLFINPSLSGIFKSSIFFLSFISSNNPGFIKL